MAGCVQLFMMAGPRFDVLLYRTSNNSRGYDVQYVRVRINEEEEEEGISL
jgi:hypothetical protein